MRKRILSMALAACLLGTSLNPTNVSAAFGEAAEAVTELKADEGAAFYHQDFNNQDSLDENGIPVGWKTAGAIGDGTGNLH